MKKRWLEPCIETLNVEETARDIAGNGAPDGLYESLENPVPAGWDNPNCDCS